MDKDLIKKRFARAASGYPQAAVVQREVARRMAGMIHTCLPPEAFRRTLEVGCGTGLFTRALLEGARPERLVLNDICPEVEGCFTDLLGRRARFFAGDAETLAFPAGQTLITSCSAIQWFSRPEAFFDRCRMLLADGGCLAFSTFGRENLREVTSVTGTSLPYRSLEELRRTLSASYDLVHSSEDLVRLTFPSPLDVLRHLKQTGVTGIRRQSWTRADLADFCRRYSDNFTVDRAVSLTYHPIYIIAKKKEQ